MNRKLAIAIPTYNRAEILRSSITSIIKEVKSYSIPIYVSDNSDDYATKEVIEELLETYGLIFYNHNDQDRGHDRNSFYVVQLPEADFVWLLGDSLLMLEGCIKRILTIIDEYRPDIISVNAANRDLDQESRLYSHANSVLCDLGWHLTLTGATIYSKTALSHIKNVRAEEFKNFPQLSLIFNFLSKGGSLFWENKKWIAASPRKKGYWVDSMFSIFIDDWSRAVRNLPSSYDKQIKERVILQHSHKANIFGFRALLHARYLGVFDYTIYRKYRSELIEHSRLPRLFLIGISLFPKFLLDLYLSVRDS